MSRIGLKFSQMILHTSTSKMMNNLPFLLVVLHKPTLWPSTFKLEIKQVPNYFDRMKGMLGLIWNWTFYLLSSQYHGLYYSDCLSI